MSMTGLFKKKYHIAILDKNGGFIKTVKDSLLDLYRNKVVVQTYDDSDLLFKDMNINKVKNNPFDLAILSPAEFAEQMVLKHSHPKLKILMCADVNGLKQETAKLLL